MNDIKIYAFADEASSNIDKQIIALKRNNLCGLEIRDVDGTNISSITTEKAKEVIKKFKDAGLKIWSIGSPIGKVGIHDDFNLHIEKLKHTLEIANILESKNMRLFSFYIPKENNADNYSNEVLEKLSIMTELSIANGITPCHENEKEIFGDTGNRCLYLAKNIPNLKLVFDPANFVQCHEDTIIAWNMLKPYVKYLHIKDALYDGDVVPAGKGIGQVEYIVKDYINNGGKDLTIEPHLFVFNSLKTLEHSDGKSVVGKMTFNNADEAFDTAVNALNNLLK